MSHQKLKESQSGGPSKNQSGGNNELKKDIRQSLQQKYNSNGKSIGFSKKKPSATLRQRYSEFLKKNHQDIDRLYDNIRKDMAKNTQKLTELRKKDPILVLE